MDEISGRQEQNDSNEETDVMQYRSSQPVENPNQESPSRSNQRKSMGLEEKKDTLRKIACMVRRWKAGFLETKKVLKDDYVQILDNGKPIGHICIHCESYFIGARIGGTQKKHECTKKPPSFTPQQRKLAKESSLKMVKTDLLPFAVVRKPGLLGFAKTMLEIGAELGPQVTRNLTIEDVKELLPHPTTLSNQINTLTGRKPQLYAILKRKSNDSGLSLMIDGTSKSYHYTGISISFIDENWIFKTVLTNLISGHGQGEGTAAYVSEKATEFLTDFGIDIDFVNAFITDEASAMVSAFSNSKKHIIACHMISTICKHTIVLYVKDQDSHPQVHEDLKIIIGLKKKLKEVVATIKGRIHINKMMSHPLYQSNETRFLSFSTSLDSFLSLTEDDHQLIDSQLSGHTVYPKYLELVEAKNDLRTIYNILYPTICALLKLEADKEPTLHLVIPCLVELYKEWSNIDDWNDPIEYSMKTAGLLALKEKLSNLNDLHYFAVILDPNVKMEIKSFLLPDRSDHTRNVTEIVQKLRVAVKEYVVRTRRYRPGTSATVVPDNPFAEAITSTQNDSVDLVVDNDINKYLNDNEKYSTCILSYWKKAAAHFPYLSSFAKYVLSIPASSCPLERSFSVLNKVDCKQRPQLDQDTITNIVLSNAMEKYLAAVPDLL